MFTDRPTQNLAKQVPGLDPRTDLKNGALRIKKVLSKEACGGCVDAIVDVYYLAPALTCLTIVGADLIERCIKEGIVKASSSKTEETVSAGTEQAREEPVVPDEPSI